ncbi:MAG: hypothetical protein JXL20_12400 [Deltaproteobacteria bacterium]|nr:hypothetical protein [Deltaproteobacteria bacterium]
MVRVMFDYAFKKTFALEGGEVNDPHDRGGHTNYGITQATLDSALKRGVVSGIRSVSELTPAIARQIYLVDFWHSIRLGEVKNIEIAAEMFDTGVNMGPGKAVLIAQLALAYLGERLDIDGRMGPQTMGLINKWCAKDPHAFFKILNGFQFIGYVDLVNGELVDKIQSYFRDDPMQQRNAHGWMKRVQEYETV